MRFNTMQVVVLRSHFLFHGRPDQFAPTGSTHPRRARLPHSGFGSLVRGGWAARNSHVVIIIGGHDLVIGNCRQGETPMAYKTIQTQTLTRSPRPTRSNVASSNTSSISSRRRAESLWRNSRRNSRADSSTIRRSPTNEWTATPTGVWRKASSRLLRRQLLYRGGHWYVARCTAGTRWGQNLSSA
jgi:hypothetical protein